MSEPPTVDNRASYAAMTTILIPGCDESSAEPQRWEIDFKTNRAKLKVFETFEFRGAGARNWPTRWPDPPTDKAARNHERSGRQVRSNGWSAYSLGPVASRTMADLIMLMRASAWRSAGSLATAWLMRWALSGCCSSHFSSLGALASR